MRDDLKFQIGQLRHLYAQMKAGLVTDTAQAADGLLAPAIAAFEHITTDEIGRYTGKDGHRDWWTHGEWLYPGDRVIVVNDARPPKP